ncbi:MAG: cytoplasmic protein [Thermoplasmata archaeon]|nr:MAG: cytoplasmic protein [Thermoplasmata archaeon]
MPMQDRTGPAGQGPRTGRGLGLCGDGRGGAFRMGCRWFGRGLRARFTRKEETEMLAEEKKELEAELEAVKERMREIEK